MSSSVFRLVSVVLAGSAILLALPSNASAEPTLGLMYTGAQEPENGHSEPNESIEEWAAIQKSGAKTFRLPITPEESGHGSSWGYYDKVFRLAGEHGVTIQPILSCHNGSYLPTTTEKEKEEWYIWVKKAVKRYGYSGTFWAENPGVPSLPVQAWEIWNEPNNTEISGEAYGSFLIYTSAAIQSASMEKAGTKTGVLFGGLLIWNNGTSYQSYVRQAYKVPGVSSSFTGFAVHPYAMGVENPISVFASSVEGVRSFLNSQPEGSGKSIWITEIGWPVEDENAVSEAKQASLLTEGFNWVKGAATTDNIKSLIWYNYRDSDYSNVWSYRCGLRDEVGNFRKSWFAFQEEAGKSRWPSATAAFQANTESLWIYTRASGAFNTLWGMKSSTNPSTGQYRGNYQAAFQANTGTLWIDTPTNGTNTGQKMAAGTSPSVPSLEGGVVAYQANTGNLSYREGATTVNTGYGMAPGTSPSITTVPARYWHHPTRYPMAFQSNAGQLWFVEPGGAIVNTGLGMAPGTSPSIAALDGGRAGQFAIAFQANTGQLWLYEPGGVVATTGLGMAPGTSPSITDLPSTHGKFAIAFQASGGNLWTYIPEGAITDTGLGMQPGTSPSISALADPPYSREFEVAFDTTSGSLWTFEPGGSVINTLYGYQSGTSPSIAPG
jgi:putative glycosyl hydrolase